MSSAGIYMIRNVRDGKFYIGSAVNLTQRWRDHRVKLKAGTHRNAKLQNAWNKHGAEAFAFEVVELIVDRSDLISREQHWLDSLQATGPSGYNLAPTAFSLLGFKHRPSTKQKLSEARKGRLPHPDAVAILRAANLGRALSLEHRARLTEVGTGRARTAESIARSAAAHLGARRSPETRARMSEAMKGKTPWLGRSHTEETKKRISIAKAGKRTGPMSAEMKARIAEGQRARWAAKKVGAVEFTEQEAEQ